MKNLLPFTDNLSKDIARDIIFQETINNFGNNPRKIKYLGLMGESIKLELKLKEKYQDKIKFTSVERDKDIASKLRKISNEAKIPVIVQPGELKCFFKYNDKSSYPLKYNLLWLDWVGGFCGEYWSTLENIFKSGIDISEGNALIAITTQAARECDYLEEKRKYEITEDYMRFYVRPGQIGIKARAHGYTAIPVTYYSYLNEQSKAMILYIFKIVKEKVSVDYSNVNMKKFISKNKNLGLMETLIPVINPTEAFKESKEYLEWEKQNFTFERTAI
jgi:hypothetical protein